MSHNYSVELRNVRGLPSNCFWLILEVIVHTPRLLSTVRRKHVSAPFLAQSGCRVAVQWAQTKTSKAFLRLRLLTGQPSSSTPGGEAAAEEGGLGRDCRKSAAVPLQLPGQWGTGAQTTQLQLQLPLPSTLAPERGGREEEGQQGGLEGGDPVAVAAEVDVLLRAAPAVEGAATATVAAAGHGFPSGTAAAAQQAWVEPSASGGMPRKRSWLLALGLGRHGSGGSGGGEPHGSLSVAAGPTCERASDRPWRGTKTSYPAVSAADGGDGGGGPWEPLALVTPAATPSAMLPSTLPVPALLAAPPRSGASEQERADSLGRACGDPSLPNATGSGAKRAALPGPAPGPETMELASPFAPPAAVLPSGSVTDVTPLATAATMGLAAAPPSCTDQQPKPPKRRRLGDFLARLFSTSSSSPGAQVRRTAAADAVSTAGSCPAAAAQASLVAMDTAAMSRASSPTLQSALSPPLPQPPATAAAVGGNAGSAGVSARRLGSPISVTPLLPPSPRLGDVYKVQDNATASDLGVQLGFETTAAAGAAADGQRQSSGPLPPRPPLPAPLLLRGLDSPGFGETSPAGGPDRLTVEPPVEDMAAASLATPMAASPGSPAGGCFFWRYGAAVRARAAAQVADKSTTAATATARSTATAPSVPAPGPALAQAPVHSGTSVELQPQLPLPQQQPVLVGGIGPGRGFLPEAGFGALAAGGEEVPRVGQCGGQAAAAGAQDWLQDAAGSHPLASLPSATATGQQPQPQRRCSAGLYRAECSETQTQGPAGAGAAAASSVAAVKARSGALEAEIDRVAAFITSQAGIEEDLCAASLSQCQFLLDCLRNPDMCWIVADSLLQLKHEVGFPFDTGVPIPGAPGWFRLVLQPLEPVLQPAAAMQPPPPPQEEPGADAVASCARGPDAEGTVAGGVTAVVSIVPPPPRAPEVLKVRWAAVDQRQAGGGNACAAIVLEVAAWCLGAVQRWRNSVAVAADRSVSGAGGRGDPLRCSRDNVATRCPQPPLLDHSCHSSSSSSGGGGGSSRRELAPLLSRSQRERLAAAAVELEAMSGAALEQCIQTGTEVWQGVLVQSPAARVASSTGDFDLEHMLQLGGYSQRLRLVDYTAASLLYCGGSGARPTGRELRASGGGGGADGASGGADGASGWHGSPQKKSGDRAPDVGRPGFGQLRESFPSLDAARQGGVAGGGVLHREQFAASRPPRPPLTVSIGLESSMAVADLPSSGSVAAAAAAARRQSQCGVPSFASVVRGLMQGVYVLGWHGHFATLWIRPGGVVHLIDSLGARLAADCPLAFTLEFDAVSDFLDFFLARHQARRDAAAPDDIAGGNLAALIEVHRLEMVQPAAAAAGGVAR